MLYIIYTVCIKKYVKTGPWPWDLCHWYIVQISVVWPAYGVIKYTYAPSSTVWVLSDIINICLKYFVFDVYYDITVPTTIKRINCTKLSQ